MASDWFWETDPEWYKYRGVIALHLPVRAIRTQVVLARGPSTSSPVSMPRVFIGYRGTAREIDNQISREQELA